MAFRLRKLKLSRLPWLRRPRITPNQRLLVIGDIHGRADLLSEMMRRYRALSTTHLGPPVDHNKVLVLGDFIDRGPNSVGVMQALYRLKDKPGLVVLKGNHEAALVGCANGQMDPHTGWLTFGGLEFLKNLGVEAPSVWTDQREFAEQLKDSLGDRLLEWLDKLPSSYSDGDFFFCHAGVRPGIDLAAQIERDLQSIRGEFLKSRRHHGKIIVHGHSVEPNVCVRWNRIGIDTGAYRTGMLSGLVLNYENAWVLQVK